MTSSHSSTQFSDTISAIVEDNVMLITIDNPPVNAVSASVRQGLMAALDQAETTDTIQGVVITGAGNTFVAGADIKEFGQPVTEPTLPQVTQRLANFGKTIIAAVNGAALGGGAEIAIACHGRVASGISSFAMPEVKLGLVPGAGGTQRLPRLIAADIALDMIGTGRTLKSVECLEIGLIDELADEDTLIAHAKNASLKPAAKRTTPQYDAQKFASVKSGILRKSRGQNAPRQAVELVEQAKQIDLNEGLAQERQIFLQLRDSDEAKSLRHVFLAERMAKKPAMLEGSSPKDVKVLGIVGMGLMGSGIIVSALNAGYQVIGVEQTEEAALAGHQRILGLLEKNLQSGRLSADAFERQKKALTIAGNLESLGVADLVIEAVFDDLEVKVKLFQALDQIIRANAILATNTSYLNPDEIAVATLYPERVIGMHFFSPAHIMRLVEVIHTGKSDLQAVATGFAVANKMRKLPILSGVIEGFIGNNIFSAYRREAEFLLEEGAYPQDIDAALEDYGFAMGLFAVYDMAGLEIAWAKRKREALTRDPQLRYVKIADQLCELGRFGQKSGLGWYRYTQGKREIDPVVTDLIDAARSEKNITPHKFSREQIQQRLLQTMQTQGNLLLENGIAASASNIDLVMINGYGFPAHKGGPMFACGIID
ncbi:3-hydroxyacyl-CoA dehydrogenase NAD-binding domain-containing protein [Paenochrobactrum sp. BZR 588]|uniref:3-hydroxyacyl-CoA dehydrogenase NAD-binding domain-containing protein n=1 Tax=unclassified Paenochrobactrum TaxID=2639760 RepID=UPI003852BB2D